MQLPHGPIVSLQKPTAIVIALAGLLAGWLPLLGPTWIAFVSAVAVAIVVLRILVAVGSALLHG